VLAKPGSITPDRSLERGVRPDKEEGGRPYAVLKGYRPQFYLRTTT